MREGGLDFGPGVAIAVVGVAGTSIFPPEITMRVIVIIHHDFHEISSFLINIVRFFLRKNLYKEFSTNS